MRERCARCVSCAKADMLVCLLPLTPQTRGILNTATFANCRKDAFVINVARGGHLIEDDLIAAIDSGHLSGAALDVFQIKPLPETSTLLWAHPKIAVNAARRGDLRSCSGRHAPMCWRAIRRMEVGEPLAKRGGPVTWILEAVRRGISSVCSCLPLMPVTNAPKRIFRARCHWIRGISALNSKSPVTFVGEPGSGKPALLDGLAAGDGCRSGGRRRSSARPCC